MFKKCAAIIAAVTFGFCFYSLYREKTPVFAAYADEYEIYLTEGSFGNNTAFVDRGGYGGFAEIKGESCVVAVSYERVLEDFSAEHLFSEKTGDGESYYAYSPKIRYKTYINGRAVNIHYYSCGRANKLGTPLIYGSF